MKMHGRVDHRDLFAIARSLTLPLARTTAPVHATRKLEPFQHAVHD